MGVISFYRGNLHKVPDTPRRWPIPKPSISLQDFKILLENRNKALQRLEQNDLLSQQPQSPIKEVDEEAEGMGDNGCTKEEEKNPENPKNFEEENKRKRREAELENSAEKDAKCPRSRAEDRKDDAPVPMECEQVAAKDGRDPPPDWPRPQVSADSAKSDEMDVDSSHKQEPPGSLPDQKVTEDAKPAQGEHKNSEEITIKLKRKHELESKLKVLTEKKHHLVQMLKHILSTEEEMKKRSQISGQTSAMNLSLPSQGEATVDAGSHTRQAGRRIGTELNCYGDLEEGELEDACTPSPHSHNLHHVHGSTGPLGSVLGRQPNSLQQPSQSSQQMKTSLAGGCHSQHNTTSSSGLMPSPSLLGTHGSHTQHAHMPPVSASAAQIGVSSPSPATSSGTSIFRDTRRTSPSWNQR